MATIIAFSFGGLLGMALGAVVLMVMMDPVSDCKTDSKPAEGIDPQELIAWIQNWADNYEYIAPPTASDIISKIREMEERNERQNDAE